MTSVVSVSKGQPCPTSSGPGELVSSLAACRRDPGARVSSLATLWHRPKPSIGLYIWKLRSLDSSATATAWHVDVYTNESYMRRRTDNNDNCSAGLGLRSNLRASNLQNFPGGPYPQTPLACACLRTHTNRSPPQSQMSSAAVVECCDYSWNGQL